MASVLDFVLDGLEAALELERELGVRTVELDRELLSAPVVDAASSPRQKKDVIVPIQRGEDAASTVSPPQPQPSTCSQELVFVHDRPLSEKGVEMMAKIILAMGRTSENTPIVVAPPLPGAKIVVVLGGLALKKYFPEMRGEPGQWQKTSDGRDVLITYSPEYILRFATVTPAVQKIKQDMWRSLKAVVQRLR